MVPHRGAPHRALIPRFPSPCPRALVPLSLSLSLSLSFALVFPLALHPLHCPSPPPPGEGPVPPPLPWRGIRCVALGPPLPLHRAVMGVWHCEADQLTEPQPQRGGPPKCFSPPSPSSCPGRREPHHPLFLRGMGYHTSLGREGPDALGPGTFLMDPVLTRRDPWVGHEKKPKSGGLSSIEMDALLTPLNIMQQLASPGSFY